MSFNDDHADDDDDNNKYAKLSYWDARYGHEESYDWLGEYGDVKHLLEAKIDKARDRILILGCGNSKLGHQMLCDGYVHIVNSDISQVCIDRQRRAHPAMDWRVLDMMSMPEIADGSFDVVLEKATLDALMVGEKSPWSLSPEGAETMGRSLGEISRILNPDGGRFLSLTFSQPHFRIPVLAEPKYGWNVVKETFGEGFHYFLYTMTKGEEQDPEQLPRIPSSSVEGHRQRDRNSTGDEGDDDEDFLTRFWAAGDSTPS